MQALDVWTHVNGDVATTEEEADAAHDVIVERLRRIGNQDAARAFADVDAVAEVWVRRHWIPPEADGWHRRAPQ
jgi:hypothetical protein